jgi:hypothetical protein
MFAAIADWPEALTDAIVAMIAAFADWSEA